MEEKKQFLRTLRLGTKMSLEAKLKISAALKGVKKEKFSDEHIKNMSLARKGMKLSDETKLKISKYQKGRKKPKRTAEHCRKISEALKGKKYVEL